MVEGGKRIEGTMMPGYMAIGNEYTNKVHSIPMLCIKVHISE